MDLPKNFDMILGCDVMKQLLASLDIERNTVQLRHRGRIVTLVMDKHKTVETTSVNGLASVSVATAELSAQHPTSFSTLEEEFGPFSTTLFVSATAGLASLNYEDPVEALGQNWTELPGPILCVPPLRLLPQVTQKLRASTPMDLVLLTPYLPRSPWFRELQPLVQKARVVPSADRAYIQQIETYGHNTPACEMEALQINRNSTAEVTTLGAIQVNRPTVTREVVEGLQLPESLDTIQQQQLRHLLLKYLHLMQPPSDDEPPPPPSEFDHRIVLTEGGSQRVQTRPIRLAADQTIELQKRFEHRCKRGIMQRAASDSETCRSAVFMVKRKDGPDRDVVDFRALNDVTVKDHFPLPLIEELLDRLSQARFFISLDLKEANYNIRMHPDSVRYTGTITHFGLFEWLVLVMGMCNAVATFQRMMDARFHHIIYDKRTVACYLDDLLIYADSFQVMMDTLEEVLQVCDRYPFRLNMQKSTWFQTHLTYLGHVIGEGQLRADPRLIGAEKAAPLYELTRTTEPLTARWDERAESSFVELKLALISEPVLRLWTPRYPTELHTDASNVGLGAVLLQQHSSGWHPMAYWNLATLLAGYPDRCSHRPSGTGASSEQAASKTAAARVIMVTPACRLPAYHSVEAWKVQFTAGRAESQTFCAAPHSAGFVCRVRDHCRTVIQRIFNLVQRDRPGLFLRKDIFRLGHDVTDLVNRKLPTVDLIIAGVPCQPFSRANPPGKGLQDDRSLFQTVHKLLVRSQATFYAIECTPFAQHLHKDLEVVQQWLGQAPQHDLNHWSAHETALE
eukprot:scaffold1268_cov387-Pavlova_lutheri.AAC.5